jgi:hypothetical protein
MQNVTPHMSLGDEVFWAGQHRKSGVGYAGRYETDKMVIGLALILYCMSYHCSIIVFEYCVRFIDSCNLH